MSMDMEQRRVYDLYMVAKGHQLKTIDISGKEDQIAHGKSRKNLEGIELKSSRVVAFPLLFTTLDDLKTRHIDTIIKFNFPIMCNLKEDLNFK